MEEEPPALFPSKIYLSDTLSFKLVVDYLAHKLECAHTQFRIVPVERARYGLARPLELHKSNQKHWINLPTS